jgi:predicted GH43/DUF377 family glycosyl hydrolase
VRTFNPGLLRDESGWLFAYRIVGPDGLRRIGICRLDHQLRVIEGTAVPLTDHVVFRRDTDLPEVARQWFADPRLYRFGTKLFVYWNSGWHEPQNHQFLQELEPVSLLPRGHPRELLLPSGRQRLEKNWTLFADAAQALRAIYSITPHRVLQGSLAAEGDLQFEELVVTPWSLMNYPPSHGGLRGGAPPFLTDGRYWSFCHSVHDALDGYRYAAAVYSFAADYPHQPIAGPIAPLALDPVNIPPREYPRLNPAVGEVIYPCGSARDGARWLVSHGINDECCAISSFEHSAVVAGLQPIAGTASAE